jgi:hypothetical protein
VALCGLGGLPIKCSTLNQDVLCWCGQEITTELVKQHLLEALGLSAVLTFTNKKNHTLIELGQICADRKETWAYHWISIDNPRMGSF